MSYALPAQRCPLGLHGLGACGCRTSAGLGELVTPTGFIWFPGRIRSWLNQINEQIRSMGSDISAHRAAIVARSDGTRFISDFEDLRSRWLAFNRDASSWSGGTVDLAQEYVNAYNVLARRYRALTGSDPTTYSELAPSERPDALRDANWALMGWAAIGIVGVVGLGYLLGNYARVKTISKLAFNKRRRRHR
jgi:hypothetical protein